MQNTSQEALQGWLDTTATLLRLMRSKEISLPTTQRISTMLKEQRSKLDDAQMHQLVLNLTDILKGSKTEAEFLQKMQTMSEDVRQFKQQPIVIFMLLLKEKKISGPIIERISTMLKERRAKLDDTQMHQLVLNLTDILKSSKTEAEFLQKMQTMER